MTLTTEGSSSASRTYPEATTRVGGRDRPHRVELVANGLWRVDWRSGMVSTYQRDPRLALSLVYEPRRRAGQ